jgi:glycosyltransferase (activator-dependent family)
MRVLFTSLEGSHFRLLVPLAWALRTADHEVRVACKPGLIENVTQAGLTAIPIDSPPWEDLLTPFHQEALAYCNTLETTELERQVPTWEALLTYENVAVPALWASLNHHTMVDGLAALARAWRPDLVIWETFCMAGPVAALAAGAAHARLVSGPDLALQMHPRREFVRQARLAGHREDPTADWLNECLQRNGSSRHFDETMLTGQWTIDTRPANLREDLGLVTVPMRYVPYNGRCVAPDWLREPPGRPRVCLTLGMSITAQYRLFDLNGILTAVLDVLADLDVEVVAAIAPSQREHLPEIPANVRVVDFVPIDDLLPTCSLVIHHGGYQTKATAERHGIPQVIISGWEWVSESMGTDYEKQETLLSVPIRKFTADLFRDKTLQVLTDPAFTENARRLRQGMLAMPTPNDVVPMLEKMTESHRER